MPSRQLTADTVSRSLVRYLSLCLAVAPLVLGACSGDSVSVAPATLAGAATGAAEARGQLEATAKSVDEAQQALRASEYGRALAVLGEIENKRLEVLAAIDDLEKRNLDLSIQKAQLEKAKDDLTRQRELLATGLVGALLAAIAGFSRWVTVDLDRRLKKLEIQEKELALRERGAKQVATSASKPAGGDEDSG